MLAFKLASIALGGAIGALLRYGLSGLTYRWIGPTFPWGTLAVNLLGSFAIGLLWPIFETTTIWPNARVFLFIGLLGAFTTFSTYTLESLNLLRDGEVSLAIWNILASNVLALALVCLGFVLARVMINLFR